MRPSDDTDLVLIPTSGSDKFIGFAVQIDGERAGTVAFRHEDKARASIRWNLADEHLGQLARVLKQAVDHAFAELGISRVETQIDAEDHATIRQAARAGL
ncbi:MAG: GNAT family N-acetyltransferase, partial [Propionibacteriales bacterium]|nr:GNAT family N-acetyltransferase [Propionibacteriales bacterium]